MKHKTIVRIIVKLIGLYFIMQGLPSALSQLANVMISTGMNGNVISTGFGQQSDWSWMIPSFLYWGAQIGLGAYLLFGGGIIINLIVPSNRRYCPECGYMLRHPIPAQCSECGVVLPNNVTAPAGSAPAPPPVDRD